MNHFAKKFLALAATVAVSSQALALIEVRGQFGANLGDAEASTVTIGSEEFPTVPAALSYGADALAYLPMVPLGLGMRYETFTASNDGELNFDLNITRISAVVNYRLIDTLIYVGPIATLGLSHDASLEVSGISGQADRKYTSDIDTTYSLGVEAGVNLIGMIIGAELGQLSMNMKNPETSSGERLGTDLDFSGMYAKLTIGIGF